MKEWAQNLVAGFIPFVVGIVLFLLPFTGNIASLNLGIFLYLFGMLTIGIGIGILANTYTIHKLEERITHE